MRFGLSLPSLIHLRIVGIEIPRCWHAAPVGTQGSGTGKWIAEFCFAFMDMGIAINRVQDRSHATQSSRQGRDPALTKHEEQICPFKQQRFARFGLPSNTGLPDRPSRQQRGRSERGQEASKGTHWVPIAIKAFLSASSIFWMGPFQMLRGERRGICARCPRLSSQAHMAREFA